MSDKLKDLIERAGHWPETEQAELTDYAAEIESRHAGRYHASSDELAAIDDADRSGVASEEQVAAAFSAPRMV